MDMCLTAPLTDDEARGILRLKATAYNFIIASGKLDCTGSIREHPPCQKPIPTILDILQHCLQDCVQSEIDSGLITKTDINEILDELKCRLEEGPPIPGSGIDPRGNLYLDSIWLLCRPPTRSASRRLAATIARTLQQCLKQFGYRKS